MATVLEIAQDDDDADDQSNSALDSASAEGKAPIT